MVLTKDDEMVIGGDYQSIKFWKAKNLEFIKEIHAHECKKQTLS